MPVPGSDGQRMLDGQPVNGTVGGCRGERVGPGGSPWAGVGRGFRRWKLGSHRPRDGPRHAARALPSVSRSAQASHPPSSLPPKSYSLSQRPLVLFLLLALTSPPPCPTQPSVASPITCSRCVWKRVCKGLGEPFPTWDDERQCLEDVLPPLPLQDGDSRHRDPLNPVKFGVFPCHLGAAAGLPLAGEELLFPRSVPAAEASPSRLQLLQLDGRRAVARGVPGKSPGPRADGSGSGSRLLGRGAVGG